MKKLFLRLLDRWPGKHRFGIYRFLPLFFLSGAAVEFVMIHLTIGGTNFYDVYRRKHPEQLIQLHGGRQDTFPVLSPGSPELPSFLSTYEKLLQEKQKSSPHA